MKPEGWKGMDALNPDDPTAFWDVVSEHKLDLRETLDDLKVGDWIYLEETRGSVVVNKRFAVVRERWVNGEGESQIRFSDPTPDDPRPAAGVATTMIVKIP